MMKKCVYDYENSCTCAEDDKCGCDYDNNMAHDVACFVAPHKARQVELKNLKSPVDNVSQNQKEPQC